MSSICCIIGYSPYYHMNRYLDLLRKQQHFNLILKIHLIQLYAAPAVL